MDTSRLAIKDDIKELKADVKEIKTDIKRIDNKLDNLQNTLDRFVGIVDDLRTENTIGAHQTRELQERVANLEKTRQAQ